jgi:hypothetical protein
MVTIFGTESFVFQFAKENIKIRLFGTTSFPAVLYGCETWSLTLREEQRPSVSASSVLRKFVGLIRTRKQETGENYIIRRLMIRVLQQKLFG